MKRTRTLRAIGAAGLVLALTGCIKLDMDLTVNADDTVDGTMIFGFNQEMSDMMGDEADMFDGMMDELLDLDLGEDAPEDVTVEPYDDGTFVGQEMTFQGVALEEFGGDGTSELRLARDGDEFVFEGDMDMSDTGEMGDIPPGMLDGMMEFDMRVSITFPGEVLEHNGSVSGTTVTWEPEIGETNDMFARASESGGGGGMPVWLWIVIGVVVVAGLVALLFLFSRSKAEPAPAAAGDQPVPPPGPAGTNPPPPAPAEPAAGQAAAPSAAPVVAPEPVDDPATPSADPVDEQPAEAEEAPAAAPGPDPAAAREPEAAPAPDADPQGSAGPESGADEAPGAGEPEEDR